MNPKIVFSLALVLLISLSPSFANEATPTNSTAHETATNAPALNSKYNLKIEIIPSTTQIHIHRSSDTFPLAEQLMSDPVHITLRIENPTSTAQDVRSYNSTFDYDNWKFSNPEVCLFNESLGSKGNELVLDKIPPGSALTHDIDIVVLNEPPQDLGDKISFRMGFTPGDKTQILWSNEVALDIIHDTWLSPSDILLILSTILVLASILIWWMARRICQRRKLAAKRGS